MTPTDTPACFNSLSKKMDPQPPIAASPTTHKSLQASTALPRLLQDRCQEPNLAPRCGQVLLCQDRVINAASPLLTLSLSRTQMWGKKRDLLSLTEGNCHYTRPLWGPKCPPQDSQVKNPFNNEIKSLVGFYPRFDTGGYVL